MTLPWLNPARVLADHDITPATVDRARIDVAFRLLDGVDLLQRAAELIHADGLDPALLPREQWNTYITAANTAPPTGGRSTT